MSETTRTFMFGAKFPDTPMTYNLYYKGSLSWLSWFLGNPEGLYTVSRTLLSEKEAV